MALYVTSDPHLGHKLVSGLRGFASTAEHDETFAESWRKTVRQGDHVWVLGDLAVSNPAYALSVVKDLPGVKHLVVGNHDQAHPMHRDSWKHQAAYMEVFVSVQQAARRRVRRDGKSVDVLLSHFPYAGDHTERDRYDQWRLRDEGAWLVHGHTHASEVRQFARSLHVGWDAHGALVPWSFVEAVVLEEDPVFA